MTLIWKEPIRVVDKFTLDLPKDSQIISVQTQNAVPCIWFKFQQQNKDTKEKRTFRVVGTGQLFSDINMRYVGTFQIERMDLVFHLFEVLTFEVGVDSE